MSIDFALVRMIAAQQELRSIHNIDVLVEHYLLEDPKQFPIKYGFSVTTNTNTPEYVKHRWYGKIYESPEEALKEGLEQAKEFINQKEENGTTS